MTPDQPTHNYPVHAGMKSPVTIPVLGTPLACTSYAELSRFLLSRCHSPGPFAVDFANTNIVTMRRHDPAFRELGETMDLLAPDGMPLVWCMNRKGAGLKDRVYGPIFTREFLASAPAETTHYLVGGSEQCGELFRQRMLALNPEIRFVGSYHGRCSADGVLDDDAGVLDDLVAKRPMFVWVGLGTPKQYHWIARVKPRLSSGVLLAVGFAFDVNAGTKRDAPLWMQRAGLTWLFRMASEPDRLVSRYFKWNTLFLWYLLRSR
jgi:N-acetylglucosaminyldiphosphoundecaprenol N-acetyl-beta-D-mannosaminyltransferase